MRLLIDLTSLYDHLTGIERFASNLSSCLIHAHLEHTYILLFKNEIHKDFLEISAFSNVECHVLKCNSRILFNQLILPMKLYRIRADIYYFPAFCAPWLFFSRRIADTIHDMSDFECYEGKAPLKVFYSRLGILHARHCSRHIVTVSEFSKGRIAEILGISRNKISVISNGVSEHFINNEVIKERTQQQIAEGQPEPFSHTGCFQRIAEKYHLPDRYLLSVSTLEPRKNIRLLIKAFHRIKDEYPDLYLVLCGRAGWNLQEVFGAEADAQKGNLTDKRIIVTGFVEDEDLPFLYEHAEWFVFPSKYEGFGIPPLEAMGMNCPVLSSDATSLPEVLGDAALYFRSGDEDSLIERLYNILGMDQKNRSRLVANGKKRAAAYSWQDSAEKLYGILERMAQNN